MPLPEAMSIEGFVFACPHAGEPLPSHKRRKLIDCPAFTKDLVLGTEHVYTFAGWLHHMNWERFEVDLAGFLAVDLCR